MNSRLYFRSFSRSLKFCTFNGWPFTGQSQRLFRKMSTQVSAKRDKELFLDVWPALAHRMVSNDKFSEIPDIKDWLKKVFDYNLQGGKKNRGLTTVLSYEMLESPEKITEDTLKLARILGWCVELMQTYYVMLDDIIDGSEMRRGVPCWYRVPGVGLGAINDALLVHSTIFYLLKTYFEDKPLYNNIVDLFNETFMYTSVGQYLDIETAKPEHKTDYSIFTIERYESIVKYKTAYYTYRLPVCLGLLLTGHKEPEAHKHVEQLCLQIGRFFQIQDDYIDCFGSPDVTGKVGTDIKEGKCSWLAVQALQRCTKAQRVVFATCYGSRQPAHIARIENLYRELQLPAAYKEMERNARNALKLAASSPPDSAGESLARAPLLFERLFDAIYQRTS